MTITRLTKCPVCGADCVKHQPFAAYKHFENWTFKCDAKIYFRKNHNQFSFWAACSQATVVAIDKLNAAQTAKDDAPPATGASHE